MGGVWRQQRTGTRVTHRICRLDRYYSAATVDDVSARSSLELTDPSRPERVVASGLDCSLLGSVVSVSLVELDVGLASREVPRGDGVPD